MFKSTPNADPSGTSFHGITIRGSLEKLTKLFGEPMSCCSKTLHEWTLTHEDGRVVTVYDYKYDGAVAGYWHVGALDQETCLSFRNWYANGLYRAE